MSNTNLDYLHKTRKEDPGLDSVLNNVVSRNAK